MRHENPAAPAAGGGAAVLPDYANARDLGGTTDEIRSELCPREPLEGRGHAPVWRVADLDPLADLEGAV
jgi:hypothetical protein